MGKRKVNQFSIPSVKQEEKIEKMLQILEFHEGALSFRKINEYMQKKHGTLNDYLENILEKEMIHREESRVQRWVQQAKFPFRKTLKEFNFSFQPSINAAAINELASSRFVEQGKNIIFVGPAGVGKTHLSISLGMEAINNGLETRFLKLDEFIDLIEKADQNSMPRLMRNFMRAKLLILDDIDFYDTGKNAGTFLFQLICKRHEHKLSTIFTSNKNFSEWGTLFDSKPRAAAALDRILHNAAVINIKGESYRVKDKMNKIKTMIEKEVKKKSLVVPNI